MMFYMLIVVVAAVAVSGVPQKRDSIFCQSVEYSASDDSQAIQGLADTLDSQPSFSHSISFTYGSATAYGCDYGNGQTISGGQFTDYLDMVQSECGDDEAGYYDVPSSKASFGITASGVGFC